MLLLVIIFFINHLWHFWNLFAYIIIGNTKLFIQSPESLFHLEEARDKHLPKIAIFLQKIWRGVRARRLYKRMKAALRFVYFLYRRSHQLFVYMYFLFTIVYIKLAKILERLHGKENVPKIESCIKVCTFISRDGSGHQNLTHWAFWAKNPTREILWRTQANPFCSKWYFFE